MTMVGTTSTPPRPRRARPGWLAAALLAAAAAASAQQGKPRMMRDYMQQLYDASPLSFDGVKSSDDWRRWRPAAYQALRKALGLERLPPRSPLKPRVVGVGQRRGYVVEKVVFETRPNFLMTANLYRPGSVTGRVPAVLCVHGHTMKGKTSAAVQIRSMNYARAGWVVLAVDATGHGERVHIGHRRTFAMVATGMTLEGVQVWDNMRAVDYLLSRPEVDGKRIGITGCSGGGNQTMYTAAVDERIAAAVPVCSVSTLRGQIFTPNGIGCQCECIPDLMRYGLENAAVCALIAPRPLLVLSGELDRCFPVVHTRVADEHLGGFYEAIGHPDRYRYVERRVPHGYPRALRELAHAWFDRWFNKRPAAAAWREGRSQPAPAESLWCFPDGKLPADSATLASLAHERGRKQLAGLKPAETAAARGKLRGRIRDEVLGGFPPREPLDAQEAKPTTREGTADQRVTLTTEPGVTIGARISRPAGAEGAAACVVVVRPKPAAKRWAHAAAFLGKGFAVVELDVRPLGGDEHVSRAGLVFGRPLVGMGAYDISRLVDYLRGRGDIDPERISLWAEAAMALPALYAVALDERVAGATLVGLLSSYVSPKPVQHPTWTFARGLLKHADVEHLAALAAPRRLVIADPVGPDLRPIPAGELARTFRAARKAHGKSRSLKVVAGAAAALAAAMRR